jgi:hypothetical protein
MPLDDLIAVCGPSCAKCPAYIATHTNNRADLQRIADEWTKSLGKTYSAEDIICDGCRVPGGRRVAYCADCNIRLCAESKGVITCAHCTECPCEKIASPKARQILADLKKSLSWSK